MKHIRNSYALKLVKNQGEILKILNEFLPYMPRLISRVGSADTYAEKIANNAYFAVEGKETNQGFIVFYANDSVNLTGFISLIVVKDEFKRNGVGKMLLEFACDIMVSKKMKEVRLLVKQFNNEAIGFYKHLGFSIVALEETSMSYVMEKALK